jgi:hypothetical protein
MYADCDFCGERYHGGDISAYSREIELCGEVWRVCRGTGCESWLIVNVTARAEKEPPNLLGAPAHLRLLERD